MTLTSGTRLGPYEVIAPLGTGGMGEVYRARDTKLARDVALKVLPDLFAGDPKRLARFEREARTLASLNHPHIAQIYGLEESPPTAGRAPVRGLVMELVEGPTLGERIRRGPIPVDEALPLARQVAEALEYAHGHGIIHRDLKPANIKVTPEGTVKVLDFGLAKALAPEAGSAAADVLANSPTVTGPTQVTQPGIILGTAAYMSPEQARGTAVDKRTDIWAFGCVLYEMLTGKRAFEGEDVTDTLVSVMSREPAWEALPPPTPPLIRRLLARSLTKDAKQRLHDIADARLEIEEALRGTAPATRMESARSSRFWLLAPWGAAVLSLAVAAIVWMGRPAEPPTRPRAPLHLAVALPEDAHPGFLALSPDGRAVVISVDGRLWVRPLDGGGFQPLSGINGARNPFWSPDSRDIGFFTWGQLKVVPAAGGPPQVLCDDIGASAGGTWNRDGLILFATRTGTLRRVAATGGACTAVTEPETDGVRLVPEFLPDGRHFLYVLWSGDPSRRGLYLASLDDPDGHRLLADLSGGVFVPRAPGATTGHLLFVREWTLMAQPFDTTTLALTGEAVALAHDVGFTGSAFQIAASASGTGAVAYLANARSDEQLTWLDRSGQALATVGPVVPGILGLALAPEAGRVAMAREWTHQDQQLVVWNLERETETVLAAPPLMPFSPVWSRDGRRVAFGSGGAVYLEDVSSPGAAEPLFEASGEFANHPSDLSPDGRWVVYTHLDPKTAGDIWLLPDPLTAVATRTPVPFLRTPFSESQGQISPDGKWIAYTSNESGSMQVYIRPFAGEPAGSEGVAQVSASPSERGAFSPRWRADGEELFFLESLGAGRQRMMAAPIRLGANPPVGESRPLFEVRVFGWAAVLNVFAYAPAPDGQRFLVSRRIREARATLEVLLDWQPP